MNAFSHSASFNPAEELHAIHEKREALLRVVKITQAVERLLKGMQAVLLLGQSSSAIPKQAIKAYESLSSKTAMLPTKQLKLRLDKLDAYVLGVLERILEIAGIDHELLEQSITDPHEEVKAGDTETGQLINDFRRSAQTSVALRVLLRERGATSPALKFSVPQNIIQQHIGELSTREETCRKQIEVNIESIQQATQGILLNENASDELKATLKLIQKNLQRDLKHVKAGKSIDDMPMMIEVVELQDHYQLDEPADTSNQQTEALKQDLQESTSLGKPGFFSRLKRWISSPISVCWKDIK